MEMSIYDQTGLWTCRVINLPCLTHCWSLITCTVIVLCESRMLLWKIFASWQCSFQLDKQLNSCFNGCIPNSSQKWQQETDWFFSQWIGVLPSLPDQFQMRTFNPTLAPLLHGQVFRKLTEREVSLWQPSVNEWIQLRGIHGCWTLMSNIKEIATVYLWGEGEAGLLVVGFFF
jgi:hypothetical protein